ncbi:TPA: TetR/AcrR family transcriptional regulator, partial [Acinetobacter baumannii]|nr:TetR/AcrR family transcriptional regulator [Acinetobacter baumannii]HAV5006643.1 TetR/AcrR family transcriptional regulator [Acinetobacter baumannii]HAV5010339.1 TetR/AcrR family transcriptional regulator [Acinetobacter baumannii]HAV5039959.1 TetR/AcrR family transcriptional regulator [Acinetobacter baumannii]HAV5047056.1 TetR/AcrR family transcriptional regulator [Acinetobacter baumannii]
SSGGVSEREGLFECFLRGLTTCK